MKSKKREILKDLVYVLVLVATLVILTILVPIAGILFTALVFLLFIMMLGFEIYAKKYRSQYISEMIIQDKTFGKIKFEKDSKRNHLDCKNFPKSFGAYQPSLAIDIYDETMNDFYFRNLECLYDRQEEILHSLLKTIWEGEEDADTSVQEELEVDISITKCGEYFLAGANVLIGLSDKECVFRPEDWVICVQVSCPSSEVTAEADMNCRTKAVCYTLEE